MSNYQIAIDGPAGAGKSTIAKLVAKELGFIYVDTGAMYRTFALGCMRDNVLVDNEEEVNKCVEKTDVSIKYIDGEQAVVLNGENVNGYIRTPEVGNAASAIAVYSLVRNKAVSIQHNLAKTENVIMDGRDIGSVVLPNANLKIYLDADVNVRAKRRYDELVAKGMDANLETITEEMKERDYRDMHRDISPLCKAEDAIVVDSSYMTVDEVKNDIITKFREVIANA